MPNKHICEDLDLEIKGEGERCAKICNLWKQGNDEYIKQEIMKRKLLNCGRHTPPREYDTPPCEYDIPPREYDTDDNCSVKIQEPDLTNDIHEVISKHHFVDICIFFLTAL